MDLMKKKSRLGFLGVHLLDPKRTIAEKAPHCEPVCSNGGTTSLETCGTVKVLHV